MGGTPFSDGKEPDDDRDRGVTDEEFASVVFDEDFVKAAAFHEPTAVERLLAAAEARAAEAELRRMSHGTEGFLHDFEDDPEDADDEPYPPGARQSRWHRPVAWVLALVMGIGMIVFAFAAVYRGASGGSRDQVPSPAPTGLEQGGATVPSASAEYSPPAVSAVPRTP